MEFNLISKTNIDTAMMIKICLFHIYALEEFEVFQLKVYITMSTLHMKKKIICTFIERLTSSIYYINTLLFILLIGLQKGKT